MVAGFIQENELGKIIGARTAGRLLGGKGFKVGRDYILMIPVGAYLSWNGRRYEGNGVDPDICLDWRLGHVTPGEDALLQKAVNSIS